MKNLITFFCILFLSLPLSAQTYFQKITSGPLVTTPNSNESSAWADYDNDGDQDLLVTSFNNNCSSCTYPILFFNNNGDGTFTRVFENEIAIQNTISGESAWGDYDNDGWSDLFICRIYDSKNLLFHNDQNGHFTLITSGDIANDIAWSQSCAWADYNKDGFLDLFVANVYYQKNFLYKNNGNGTFTKITSGSIVNDIGASRGCAWGDYDNDGWQDLYVVNTGGLQDFLYHNNGDGTFTRILNVPMVSDNYYAVRCQWVDFDNNGTLDLFETIDHTNKLFSNAGNGNFTETNAAMNQEDGSFGVNWQDYNNDGFIDVALATYFRNNSVYKNNGSVSFFRDNNEIVNREGEYGAFPSWADYNNDGKMDLIFTTTNDNSLNNLYKNNGTSGNYLICKLKGCLSNRSAIGAKIKIYKNSFFAMRVINGGGSGSQDMLWQHFGLGNITNLDSIVIDWPFANSSSVFRNVSVNRSITIDECDGIITINSIKLNLTSYIEGFYYTPFGHVQDTVNIELRQTVSPFPITGSAKTVLDINGNAIAPFVNIASGNYYIVVRHRNSLETWSKPGGESFTAGDTTFFNFSVSSSQAFGNNLKLKGSKYCIFSGDVNRDGFINLHDLILVYNDAAALVTGYVDTDVTGDNYVDLSDLTIVYNNSGNFVSVRRP